MQLILPFCLMCIVVLQQVVSVTSAPNHDGEIRRFPTPRRLRAPLMGRSIVTEWDDDFDSNDTQSNSNEIHQLRKRRYGLTLLGRRKWMTLKRKGPLFG